MFKSSIKIDPERQRNVYDFDAHRPQILTLHDRVRTGKACGDHPDYSIALYASFRALAMASTLSPGSLEAKVLE